MWNVDEFCHILLYAEFSAMDYSLNIVSKCCFFFIFKHSQARKGPGKFSYGSPGKVLDFLSVKEWEPWLSVHHMGMMCVKTVPLH